MTLQSAASDLALLESAAREAGALCREMMKRPLEVKSKGPAGPVTNIDLAIDVLLAERLREARADYGWLSEETPDIPEQRLGKRRVFMLDPIDGTSALVAGKPDFTISIGIVENGAGFAGAIYAPLSDEMFLGAPGLGATLNGAPIEASKRTSLEGANAVGKRGYYEHGQPWPDPWPDMHFTAFPSIAYRLAKVASGAYDFVILAGPKHEWDIAAGAAILEAAGGKFTDGWGEPFVLNQAMPRTQSGVVAAGAALHPLLIERTDFLPRQS
jgi:myo-inositol-1(or 4)-monophosphatase